MRFTPEHQELRRTTRRIIDKQITPFVEEWEAAGIFPARKVFKILGDAGLLGIHKPVEYGGLGLDYSYEIAFAEELGHIRAAGVAIAIGVQSDMCTPALATHGSDALRREWLSPTIAGDLVGCIGVSETGAGSDVASLKTFARKDGGDYLINGSKMWITNGTQADWMCMLANTSNEGGPYKNKSLIVVPMNTKGITVARKLDKLGLRSSDTAQLFFDDVRVPQSNRIGDENRGFIYQMAQFQEERLFSSAKMITFLEDAIRETLEYTHQRQAFARSILDNQAVQFKLAELQTEVECLRSLVYAAVERYVGGEDVTRLASMAKLKAGRLGMQVPTECMQFWGGQGYMNETQVSRVYRDARITAIAGGANEIMLQIISKLMAKDLG